jgi:hypothetical protein
MTDNPEWYEYKGLPYHLVIPIQEGDRVRYSDSFLATCDPRMFEHFKEMRGTVIDIHGDEAQLDCGPLFRCTSMVELSKLQKI